MTPFAWVTVAATLLVTLAAVVIVIIRMRTDQPDN